VTRATGIYDHHAVFRLVHAGLKVGAHSELLAAREAADEEGVMDGRSVGRQCGRLPSDRRGCCCLSMISRVADKGLGGGEASVTALVATADLGLAQGRDAACG
jgi:hypothetical protein